MDQRRDTGLRETETIRGSRQSGGCDVVLCAGSPAALVRAPHGQSTTSHTECATSYPNLSMMTQSSAVSCLMILPVFPSACSAIRAAGPGRDAVQPRSQGKILRAARRRKTRKSGHRRRHEKAHRNSKCAGQGRPSLGRKKPLDKDGYSRWRSRTLLLNSLHTVRELFECAHRPGCFNIVDRETPRGQCAKPDARG